MRFLTAGESHGKCLLTVIEGIPAGLTLTKEDIDKELARRQHGYGRGGRMKIEQDQVEILSGVRGGLTLGSPVALSISNRDWENWRDTMSPEPEANLTDRAVTHPRPGHVDLSGAIKYGHRDMRNVLERSSARETAARVAAGAVAKKLLQTLGIEIVSHVISIGPAALTRSLSLEEILSNAPVSPVFCADPHAERLMLAEIDRAKAQGDTLGGVFEIICLNLPVGLGSYVHWDRKLDGRLAQSIMSIQAVKGVEIGLGFAGARMPGSQVQDEIMYTSERGFYHPTNNAGGLEGGVTNGEPLVIRAAMKPIPTLMQPLKSVDFLTKKPYQAAIERSDVCAVPAAAVVGEAAAAFTLAEAVLEKFGGDSMEELGSRVKQYRTYVRQV